MNGAKKVCMMKNQFCHACQPHEKCLKLVHIVGFFDQLFPNSGTIYQKLFWLKSIQMVRTISGLMPSEFRHKCGDSSPHTFRIKVNPKITCIF